MEEEKSRIVPNSLEDWLQKETFEIGCKNQKWYETIYDLDLDDELNKPYMRN